MGYDLYFYRRGKEPLTEEAVGEFLEELPQYQCSDEAFPYYNEATGVYFFFEFTDTDEVPSFRGFHKTGLCFRLNYIRPTYFALEALPVVGALTEALDLLVYDPQNREEEDLPTAFNQEALFRTWYEGNFIAAKITPQNTPFLPRERSEALWHYMRNKEDMQSQLGDDSFVPKMLLFRQPGSTILRTAVSWTSAIPQVFSECDFVIILKKQKDSSYEKGTIPYDELLNRFGRFMEPFDGPVPKIKILRPEGARFARRAFDQLQTTSYDRLIQVALDGFVDVEVYPYYSFCSFLMALFASCLTHPFLC